MKKSLLALTLSACTALASNQASADAQGSPFIELLARSTEMWTGDPLPAYPDGTPELSVLKIVIPPQSRLPLHLHPVMNVAYVARGTVKIQTDDGRILDLVQDDVMIEIVDIWHEGINEGDVETHLIVFYAGVRDEPVTVYDDPADALQPLAEGD